MTYDSDPADTAGTFAANTWGRLGEVAWGSCSNSVPMSRSYTEEYSYDIPGDVIAKRLSIYKGGNCTGSPIQITANFVYDTEGKLTSTTYPSINGGSANTTALDTYDAMSRLQGVSTTENLPAAYNCAGPWSGSVAWASSAAYTTANQLSSLTRFTGASDFCPMGDSFGTTSETFKYNVNNQLTDIEAGAAVGGIPVSEHAEGWFAITSLPGITTARPKTTARSPRWTMDARPTASRTNTTYLSAWLAPRRARPGRKRSVTMGSVILRQRVRPPVRPNCPLPGVNAAKNWLTGYTYDLNGNVGSYSNFSLGYDPANRLSYASTGSLIETYTYDASNHRIERINSSLDTVYFFSPSGALLSEFNCLSTCTLIYNRIYFGGMVLGSDGETVNGTTLSALGDTFTWTDRLGSAQSTYPYGTDIGSYPAGADAVDFATYTKEGSTGLEYAMNRYYSGGLGRFMSADPLVVSAHLGQSWKLEPI